MWEAIASNRRKSILLISLMGVVLVLLGFAVGGALDPQLGAVGAVAGLVLWLLLWGFSATAGDSVLLSSAGAHRITRKSEAPQLWNVVEEMTIASGMSTPPKLYIIEAEAPNAFAVGHNPKGAAVAVTSGLLKRLNRDELQGVIAHEISHIRNQDVRFMTLAALMLGTTVLIADLFFRVLRYGGGRRTSRQGQGQMAVLIIALVLAILAPLFARILFFACSRRREFLADASGARFTRYPEGLASALEKISRSAAHPLEVNRAVAPLFIVNPLQGFSSSSIFSTHPPAEQRIQILRKMGGMAGYKAYEEAFRKVSGAQTRCLSRGTLASDENVEVRKPEDRADRRQEVVERVRQATDVLSTLGQYFLIPCGCGVRIKIPPEATIDSIACPRCGRQHPVPPAAERARSAAPA